MDISSKLSVTLSPTDAETLFKKAMLDYLNTHFGIITNADNVMVKFKTTMEYDQFDRGPGSPAFAGAEVTIDQAAPKKDPVMPWHHGSCNRR